MRTIVVRRFIPSALIFVLASAVSAGAGIGPAGQDPSAAKIPAGLRGLLGPFDLAAARTPEIRYYVQETQFGQIGFDGKKTGLQTYTLKLSIVPAALSGKGGDECTVREFLVRLDDGEAQTIRELAGWSYVYRDSVSGLDGQGQVFGIPHAKFESLTTNRGVKLGTVACYPIYNSFIDFHGFCDAFARPTTGGGGIQDLKAIGQAIRHAAAFTEPPVNLGAGIKPGSVFRNGDVRLVFKGVGLVDGAACAIIGYDSGESTLKMIVPVSADKDIVTEGGSEYIGDIYLDLATRWARRVTLDEFVITETRLPGSGSSPGQKIQAYTVRHLLTRLVSREEFER